MRTNKLTGLLLLLCLAGTAQAQQPVTPADSAASVADAGSTELTVNQRQQERGLTSKSNVFVPRGQWIFGGTASYSTHSNDSYNFLVVEGIDSKGYTFKVSPLLAYAFRDNMALGARFIYGRTLLQIDGADIKMGDPDTGINLTTDYYYAIRHSYTFAVIWRQYIPLGNSKRFALFTETQLAGGGTQAKFAMEQPKKDQLIPYKGTYETGYHFSLGVSPGLIAFATNNMAVEVSVGVMGIQYSHTKQTHNRISVGERSSSNMNFKVNIFSIGLGISFYL